MKKPLLAILLKEVHSQISFVEPHGDMESDCIAHQNALTLLTYLIEWSEGRAELRRICRIYFESKVDHKTGRDVDDVEPP